MSRSAANTVWARAFVDELARCGIREVCVAPGSRSTPLVLAFASDGRFHMRVHLDERSAGFFALGVGKATGIPAVVLTTSGTATANLFPAVMEASQAETPLLVLTADRPHRLRDADANQAVDQLRLYGPFARAFFDMAPPVLEGPALRHLRTVACRAVAAALGLPAGPVHLNFPFDPPFEPSEEDPSCTFADRHPRAAGGRPGGAPWVAVGRRHPVASEEELEAWARRIRDARRPLLIAGPAADPGALGPAVRRFAAATGVPVLADSLSGARHGGGADAAANGAEAVVCGGYDLFLRDAGAGEALAPDLVLRVGRSPTSATLLAWLDDCGADTQLVIDPSHRWKDHEAIATDVLRAEAADALARLAATSAGPGGDWAGLWRGVEAAVSRALGALLSGEPFEGLVAREVMEAVPGGGTLFVSNSMPVRDLDAFGGTRAAPLAVLGNRGASGIDGIVSTALGVAAGAGKPVVALLGDLALLHDGNGLLAAREPDARVVFVVVNNDGGGIFHFLPVREHEPHFGRFFATPHGLEPERLAALHGLGYERVAAPAVGARVKAALAAGGSSLIEVRSDREANRLRRDAVVETVRAAVARHLDESGRRGATRPPGGGA